MELDNARRWLPWIALAVALAVPFLVSGNIYLLTTASIALVFIIYTEAWNFLAASGQGSLGHAAFFGLGAYASALIATGFGLPPVVTSFLGGLFAAGIGVLIGLTCVRLKEWFLAMVTFGFAIIIQTLMVSQFAGITGGWDGTSAPPLVPSSVPFAPFLHYYLILAVLVAVLLGFHHLLAGRTGLAFAAIRENETEARASGIDPIRYKLFAFAVSAAVAGVAGALEVHQFAYVTPEIFGTEYSFWPIVYAISGGLGTLAGPIVGTIAVTLLWEGLRGLGLTYARFVIIGLLLVLIVIFLPKGLISLPERLRERREQRERDGPPP
ncbi:MAG: branched-chain amino acid ABC transporter permease [Methanospirillum sp.]|nr:branched-chain amino acid ABC transporter permease [Methanospirillum sp.]